MSPLEKICENCDCTTGFDPLGYIYDTPLECAHAVLVTVNTLRKKIEFVKKVNMLKIYVESNITSSILSQRLKIHEKRRFELPML